jgi:protein-disulfide isomerase
MLWILCLAERFAFPIFALYKPVAASLRGHRLSPSTGTPSLERGGFTNLLGERQMERPQATPSLFSRFRALLDVVATLGIIAVSLSLIWVLLFPRPQGSPSASEGAGPRLVPTPPSHPVSLDGAWIAGNKSAKVAIIEYSDFQCPYCGTVEREALPEIRKRYVDSGKVLLAFRHLPLEGIHPFALNAAQAAECAGREGKFWEMHDRLFARQGQLDDSSLRQSFSALGLGGRRFDDCLAGSTINKIRGEAKDANALAVTGTPTFLFGRTLGDGRVSVAQRLSGALPTVQFEQILDRLLESAQADLK